jgi:opacity protein-like surface antigen
MRLHPTFLRLALAILCAASASAAAPAQTDVALSAYGAFSSTAGSNIVLEEVPANSAGGMVELRHISNPLIGYEATYSFNRANERFEGFCSFCSPVSVSADAHEITGDWIVSIHAANLRPFALAGIGVLLNEPSGNQSDTQSATTAVYVYGAGLDWGLLPHLGLRFQYRGNFSKAPDITTVYSSVDAFRHTAEPMIGAYFRF